MDNKARESLGTYQRMRRLVLAVVIVLCILVSVRWMLAPGPASCRRAKCIQSDPLHSASRQPARRSVRIAPGHPLSGDGDPP